MMVLPAIARVSILRISLALAFCVVCAAACRAGDEIAFQLGDPLGQITAQLGPASGTIKAGTRQILTYPDGSLEFRDQRLTKMGADFLAKANARKRKAAFEKEQMRKGLVRYGGQWMPLAEKAQKEEALRALRSMSQHSIVTCQLHTHLFNQASNYFAGALLSEVYQQAAQDKRAPLTPAQSVSNLQARASAFLYVPPAYDGTLPYGLCVDIRPYDSGNIPRGYRAIADARHLIWISPNQAGDEAPAVQRWVLALDSLATAKKDFCIDTQRVFANGLGGGGATAFNLLMLFPEQFKGAVSHAHGVNLKDMPVAGNQTWISQFRYLSQEELKRVAALNKKWIFISGPGDPRYAQFTAVVPQWKDLGFDVWLVDVPSMGAADAPPASFESALDWLEGKE